MYWKKMFFVGLISGMLGSCIGIGLTLWVKLPDRTFDLLAFTENAFGIGITVIALIVALSLLNLPQRIDKTARTFKRKVKGFDKDLQSLKDQMETIEGQLATAQRTLELLNNSVKILSDEQFNKPYYAKPISQHLANSEKGDHSS